MTKHIIKAAAITAALLASTSALAQETHYVSNTGRITMTYRCFHLATAAGNPREAEALLRLGDYEGMRRGLSGAIIAEIKGYSRRWSEEDIKTHGNPTAAYNALGCSATARTPIVTENPNQRVPPQ